MPWVKDSVGSGVGNGAVHPLNSKSKAMPAQKIFLLLSSNLCVADVDYGFNASFSSIILQKIELVQ